MTKAKTGNKAAAGKSQAAKTKTAAKKPPDKSADSQSEKRWLIPKSQAAFMVGLTTRRLTDLQTRTNDPFPVAVPGPPGKPGYYCPQQVCEWKAREELRKAGITDAVDSAGKKINRTAEEARLTKERADGQALKNSVMRKELARVPILEYALKDIAAQWCSKLDALPMKVKKRMPDLPARALETIKSEIVKIQNTASGARLDYEAAIRETAAMAD